jgi:putative Holliday junction resolvase
MADEAWMDEDHVILTDEDGKEHTFEVVDVIEVESKEYAILAPAEGEEEEIDPSGEAMIFRIDHDDEGEQVLVEIEDDDEWERVAAEYDRLVDEDEDDDEFEDEEEADEGDGDDDGEDGR